MTPRAFLLALAGALALDLALGDPAWLPHPVRGIGKLITWLEGRLYPRERHPGRERRRGLVLAATVVTGTFAATTALLWLARHLFPGLEILLTAYFIYASMAIRDLGRAATAVYVPLRQGNLQTARQQLQLIVSRDTMHLPEGEVARATVETVAENTVDAVIAPLFYALLGGAPLAMAYRAANTLDAMVGYRNERYRDFGRTAARLDDAANYLPARVGGAVMLGTAAILGYDWRRAWYAWRRNAGRHPSPNAGIPEAVMAGALGVRLGGTNFYHGRPEERPAIGPEFQPVRCEHIGQAVQAMYAASLCFWVMAAAAGWWIRWQW
ncbi:MAG: cobalamin biosynthesis protein CobD [Clostridia bacterium]|nr:MAG: cobalamin biosynthesis protein CobD [Clostridia bacterium]